MILQYVSVPEQGRRNTTLGDPVDHTHVKQEAVSGFGHLKLLLGAISAAYMDREVSPRLPAWNLALTDHFVGIYRR